MPPLLDVCCAPADAPAWGTLRSDTGRRHREETAGTRTLHLSPDRSHIDLGRHVRSRRSRRRREDHVGGRGDRPACAVRLRPDGKRTLPPRLSHLRGVPTVPAPLKGLSASSRLGNTNAGAAPTPAFFLGTTQTSDRRASAFPPIAAKS